MPKVSERKSSMEADVFCYGRPMVQVTSGCNSVKVTFAGNSSVTLYNMNSEQEVGKEQVEELLINLANESRWALEAFRRKEGRR